MAAPSPSKTRAVPAKARSPSIPATFTTAPSGASDPCSTAMPPSAWIGLAEAADDRPVGGGRVELGQVLGHRPARDGQAVTVEQARLEQLAEHDRDAADPVEVDHVVAAVRLHVGEVRAPAGRCGRSRRGAARPGPRSRSRAGGARRWSSRRGPSPSAIAFSKASLVMIWRGRMPCSSKADHRLDRSRRRDRRAGGRPPAPRRPPAAPCRAPRPPRPWCWR